MSGAEYGRYELLRLTTEHRSILVGLVMREIETFSTALAEAGGGTKEERQRLRDLRSLNEQLAD
jgi:hypothetical protein